MFRKYGWLTGLCVCVCVWNEVGLGYDQGAHQRGDGRVAPGFRKISGKLEEMFRKA